MLTAPPSGGSYMQMPYNNSDAVRLCMRASSEANLVNFSKRDRACSAPYKRPSISASFESPSKRPYTPFATRSTQGYQGAGAFVPVRTVAPTYNPMDDPHLTDYYERKFGRPDPRSCVWRLCSPPNGDALGLRRSHSLPGGGGQRMKQLVYKVAVTTADLKGCGTSTPVFLTLKGEAGTLQRTRLQKRSGTTKKKISFKFSPGSTHIFKLPSPDLGDIRSVVIEHNSTDERDSWLVQNIEVFNTASKKSWMFVCNHWLSLYKEDGQTTRELFGVKSSKTKYEIVTVTANEPGAGTLSRVFVTLHGKTGITPRLQLSRDNASTSSVTGGSASGSRPPFRVGQSDKFVVKASCVGPISKIRLQQDNSGGDEASWLPERLVITDLKHPKWKFYFNCGEWLARDKGDGAIAREIRGSRDPMGIPRNTEYRVTVFTGNKKGSGTDADVFIQLFGEGGTVSREEPLRGPFVRNSVNEFILIHKKQLGPLTKIRMGHNNKGFAPGWFVDKVIIDDKALHKVYQAPCGMWFAEDEADGKIVRDLPVGAFTGPDFDPRALSGTMYEIKVFTGDKANAGTDAKIHIVLYGPAGGGKEHSTGRVMLKPGSFTRNRTDTFNVDLPLVVSPVTKLDIGHDNSGVGPGWYLDKIVVNCSLTGIEQTFLCNNWLSRDEGDKKIERTLTEAMDQRVTRGGKVPVMVTVYTSKMTAAGTDAKVNMVLYGSLGKTDDVFLEKQGTNSFESGSEDSFKLSIENVGVPYKMRIGHDNSGSYPGWHLDKVLVQNLISKDSFIYSCNRWMSLDEDDHALCREMPATGPGIKHPAPLCHYKVQVFTGTRNYAGTDANVFCNIYGALGDTGDRGLTHSSTYKNKFEKGHMDEFVIEAVKLGALSKVRIGHDGKLAGAGWYLDKVVVEEVEDPVNKATFECHRWFDIKEDDGLIVRELKGSTMLDKITYDVSTKTGDMMHAGTDANVFIRVFGTRGDSGTLQLKASDAAVNKFERGRTDTFKIEAEDLGEVSKIRISHDGSGPGAGWYLSEVRLLVPHQGKQYVFGCHRWIATDEADGKLEVDLDPSEVLKVEKTISYEVTVYTGDIAMAGTDANVFLQIYGADGLKTQQQLLRNRSDLFERGYVDKIKLNAKDVGPIRKIRIGHDGEGRGAGWFLEKVCIQRFATKGSKLLNTKKKGGKKGAKPIAPAPSPPSTPPSSLRRGSMALPAGSIPLGSSGSLQPQGSFRRARSGSIAVDMGGGEEEPMRGSGRRKTSILGNRPLSASITEVDEDEGRLEVVTGEEQIETYWFFCNRWLARGEDDNAIVRELLPTSETGERLSDLDELTYTVTVKTGTVMGAGTDANVFFTMYGADSDSGERPLVDSLTHKTNKFETNSEDVFKVSAIELGPLKKVKIRHDNKGGGADWYLDYVIVHDPKLNKEFCFPCQRWLAKSKEDGQLSRDLIAVDRSVLDRVLKGGGKNELMLERKDAAITYHVSIKTGTKMGAGTDANVTVILFGEDNDTGEIALKKSSTNRNKFESGQTDVFTVEAVNVGPINKIRLQHDNSGGGADWYVDYVDVDCPKLGLKWHFSCSDWFSKSKGDGQVFKELLPSEMSTEEYIPRVPYEISVFTSDLKGSGTSAAPYIQIYGSEAVTERKELCPPKEKSDKFKRGAKDVFVLELEDVGDTIEKIRVGHDNHGMMAGWHLDRVEIRRLKRDKSGSLTYIFPCKRWLARDEEDTAIERELVPQKMLEESSRVGGEVKRRESILKPTLTNKKYIIKVYTGDIKGAGTDANIFLNVFGDRGDTGERKLAKSETYSDKFERGHCDVFNWEALDLGSIFKIKVRNDNSGIGASWYLDKVEIIDPGAPEPYVFHCERWLSNDKDDKKLERSFFVKGYQGDMSSSTSFSGSRLSVGSTARESFGKGPISGRRLSTQPVVSPADMISYTIRVSTGFEKDMGSPGPVWVNILGAKDLKTGQHKLELMSKDKFMPGSKETFSIEALDVKDVVGVQVINECRKEEDGWFLEEIKIDLPVKGKSYKFPAKAWLAKDKQDGKTSRVFYLNEGDANCVKTFTPSVPYEVTVITGDAEGAGTDCKIFFQVSGAGGTTPEYPLDKASERFERGRKDFFKMDLENVGKLKKMRIWHNNKGTRKSWFLERIEMRNMQSYDLFVFDFNDYISETKGNVKKLSVEIPAKLNGKEQVSRAEYKITVKTSNVSGAGTDANVFIRLYGENGDSGDIHLKSSQTNKDPFETNQTDIFVIPGILHLGSLARCRVWHDNKGIGAAWHLEYIDVQDMTSKRTFRFNCNKWLSYNDDDKQISRDLICEAPDGEKKEATIGAAVFDIEVTTGTKRDSGMTQNAWIILAGDRNTSSVLQLSHDNRVKTPDSSKRVFQRGQKDNFRVKTGKPLGKLTRIFLGAVEREDNDIDLGVGREAKWLCEEVAVRDTNTGSRYVFSVGKWINIMPQVSKKDSEEVEVDTVEEDASKAVVSKLRSSNVVKYEVIVYTGDKMGCGTNANVHLTLFGEKGDSGKRPLMQKGRDLFERKQIDKFPLECVDLGKLQKLKIEHDNSGFRPDWFLDKVEVINQSTFETFTFPCDQWLAEKKGDNELYKVLQVA